MALQEIIIGMKVDFKIKVEQSTCKKPINISDTDIAESSIKWKSPSGVEYTTGLAFFTDGTDGYIVYSMVSPPVGSEEFALDESGIWKASYTIQLTSGYVLRPLEPISFEVLADGL